MMQQVIILIVPVTDKFRSLLTANQRVPSHLIPLAGRKKQRQPRDTRVETKCPTRAFKISAHRVCSA